MSHNEPPRRTALSRAQRKDLDLRIAAKLAGLGLEPYGSGVSTSNPDHAARSLEKERRPKAKWLFPSTGLLRAAKVTHQFLAASREQDLSQLRLVTLRAGDRKPDAAGFVENVDAISHGVDTFVDHLSRIGLTQPLLSAVHIRVDSSGGAPLLDPHLHGVWQIAAPDLEKVRSYLADRFATVWIDAKPIRNLRRAAFYVCAGVVDYPALLDWPDELLIALWTMPRRRMIRRAGWASEAKQPSKPGARRALKPRKRATEPLGAAKTPSAHGGNKRALRPAGKPEPRSQATSSTVRHLAPERSFALRGSPTVNELHMVLWLVRLRIEGGTSFRAICRRFEVREDELMAALANVEAYLQASLFFPGDVYAFVPTDAGRVFAARGTPLLQELDFLAVELGQPAYLARQTRHVAERRERGEIP